MIVDTGGRRWLVADAAAALLVVAVSGFAMVDLGAGGGAWLPLAVLVGAPVAVRRRWPLPAAGVALAAALFAVRSGAIPTVAAPAPYAAVALTQYLVGVRVSRPAAAVTIVVAAVAAVLVIGHGSGSAVLIATMVCAPWALGRYVGYRRARAERAGTELAEHAVAEDRLRIARDMHDVIGHDLSLIAVKASVARHVALARPQESQDALAVIETASREALTELRRVLGLLREGADTVAPAGTEEELRELADRARQAGVELTVTLRRPELPPDGVRLTVYRIVQEALTNVVRHAGPTRCRLAVVADATAVTVEISDEGRRGAPPRDAVRGAGHGLRGMRERVAAYDGTLVAAAHPAGGFRVAARIPYPAVGEDGRP
ncbi:sensor histidine kinase [Actinocatenispora comari]|uniref:histidine kinase n=1 Tax=Actinocatenispora comari TaxID=2807577 RepID=A0A8J4AE72_9ACTN|nr:sensor histidine kinase [Actinocatenispora comari]GIL27995.1 two-component sensor histidine kinase [Actinocatenispora comari]